APLGEQAVHAAVDREALGDGRLGEAPHLWISGEAARHAKDELRHRGPEAELVRHRGDEVFEEAREEIEPRRDPPLADERRSVAGDEDARAQVSKPAEYG